MSSVGGGTFGVIGGGTFGVVAGGGVGASYAEAVLADSPWLFWLLDEPSGSAVADSSGNGRDGVLSGTYTRDLAGPGGLVATGFAGGGNAWASTAVLNDSSKTFECWVRIAAGHGASQTLFGLNQGGGVHDSLVGVTSAGRWAVYAYTGSQQTRVSTEGYTPGAWHLISMVWDGASWTLYIDGTLVDAWTVGATYTGFYSRNVMLNQGAALGSSRPAEFAGFAAFDYPLTSHQVAAHYAAGS